MTNLLRFDFNDRDGIFEVVGNGHWVRATDYDALAAKLAKVEAERDHWETVAIARQARGIVIAQKLDAAKAKLEKSMEALLFYACDCDVACEQLNGTCGDTAAAALRELMARIQTGEKE
jgi:hypothetical protein